jgi:NarL family two-component system response regulator LiaR
MSEPRAIRVVVVDDHPQVRLSLRLALLAASDIEVVGEAADGEEALQVCADLQPDVVLMDLRLPGRNGVATIRALQAQQPIPQVLVLTAFYDEQLIPEAIAAGACGYLLKAGEIKELFAAIRATRPRR